MIIMEIFDESINGFNTVSYPPDEDREPFAYSRWDIYAVGDKIRGVGAGHAVNQHTFDKGLKV